MELDLLDVLKNKSFYDRFIRFVAKHSVSVEAHTILMDMGVWFKKHEEIDWSTFVTWFFHVRHPTMKEDKAVLYHRIFAKLIVHTPTIVADEVVKAFIARDFGERIGDIAMRVSECGGKGKL